MTFEELRQTNLKRCEKFHVIDEWLPSQWSNAAAGEIGECCNLTKKMDRVWPASQFKIQMNKEGQTRIEELEEMLETEIGDAAIYLDLLATRIGKRFEDCIKKAFNGKSIELGMSERLGEQE